MHDSEAGLYDFHARMYEPKTGRFTSKDPVRGLQGNPQTLNPYACSVNNPLRFPDPSGLQPYYGLATEESGIPEEGDYYTSEEEASSEPSLSEELNEPETLSGTEGCPTPPEGPEGASLDENVQTAEYTSYGDYLPFGGEYANDLYLPFGGEYANDLYFANQVAPGGDQDYKGQSPEEDPLLYEDFGNFNYGATGAATGYSDQTLYRAAGAVQSPGARDPAFGTPYGGYPYGDDPADQEQIMMGIEYYENGCGDF